MLQDDKKYTEEEKDDLFKKLYEIGKLFGLCLHIEEDNRMNNSSAVIGEDKVKIGLTWEERPWNSFYKLRMLTYENIENYHTHLNKDDYSKIPYILASFMHEVSHLLTMTDDDIDKYWAYKSYLNGDMWKYRNHPYEKLADNLAYELLYLNYDSIIGILTDKEVIVDCDIVNANVKVAVEFKRRFVQ